MKKLKSFASALVIMSFFMMPMTSVFAQLGDVTPPPPTPPPTEPIPEPIIVVTPPADTTPPIISLTAVTGVGSTSVDVTWTTSEPSTAQVEYGTTSSYGSTSSLDSILSLTHNVTLSGLTASTIYHYRIKSTDSAGNLITSSDATFTTESISVQIPADTTAPIISEVATVSALSTVATISWLTNELTTSTFEYGTTLSYGSSATLDVTALLIHNATIINLTPSITYYYCIHSTDLAGNITNSCGHTFTTENAPIAPDTNAPVIANVIDFSLSPSGATISWDTDELAISTLEYGTTMSYGSHAILSTSALLSNEAVLIGLSANTTYHYCIHSTDLAGNTSNSCGHNFMTEAIPVLTDMTPPDITLITVAPITSTSATITYTTSEVSNEQIEYGTTANYGNVTTFNEDLALTHTVTILNLTPNTLYHYRIRTSDQIGNETVSAGETFMTEALPNIVIEIPTETTPPITTTPPEIQMPTIMFSSVEVGQISKNSVTIAWTTSVPADSQIEYGDSEDFGFVTPLNSEISISHIVEITGLDSNTNYIFRVKSKPAGSFTVASSENYEFNTLSEAIPIVPPANIISVSSGSLTTTGATIIWTTDKLATSQVEYGTDTSYGLSTPESVSMQSLHEVALASLTSGTTYHFRVRSTDEMGNITYSENYSFTTSGLPVFENENTSENISTPIAPSEQAPVGVPLSRGNGAPAGGARGVFGGNSSPSYESTLVKATPADKQIIFSWQNPGENNFLRTVIVKKEGSYPSSPSDGQIIYQGRAETFADINIQNGKTYYYAMYSYNVSNSYSVGIKISASPDVKNKEVKFNETGFMTPLSPIEHFTRVLKKGDKDIEVEHLQEILFIDHNYPKNKLDGKFGSLTEKSLKSFQKGHGLAITGIVDEATQNKLNAVSQSELTLEVPGDYILFETNLKQGDQNKNVFALQRFLVYEGSFSASDVNGIYGKKTKQSVMVFQRKYGIFPPVGYAGYKTRHKMRQLSGL